MTRGRTAARWAWVIAAATALSQLWILWLFAANQNALPDDVASYVSLAAVFVVLAPVFPALGAVILRKYPAHPIGWLLCAAALVIVADSLARGYAVIGLYLRPGELPGPQYAAWFADWNWFPSIMVLLFYLPLLFPDGHLPRPRWRPGSIAGGCWIALATVGFALVPEPLVGFPDVPKPVEVPAAMVLAVLMLLTPVAIGAALAAVVVRRRRATGVEREQMRWLVYAVAVSVVGWTISMVLGVLGVAWGLVPAILTLGPLALLPIAITIAIVQYRLYDIDIIINRTLVYGGLTAIVLAGYAALVLAVTAATGSEVAWRGSVLVVVAVALLAYPLRDWLQGSVNRLMYGDRDDPARALALLSRRVGDAVTPETLLPAVAEAVRQALRVPYVAITLTGRNEPAAASGTPRGDPHTIDLIHQSRPVGQLQVAVRPGGAFTAADLRLLQDIAPQVAVAAHTVLLAADLQRSRERLVLAREEERRRLRRDLHDGVGSELAGLALAAGNAGTALPDDPAAAQRWVQMLEEGIRATVGDIRRIVDDLRPPALDELGLAGALQERADALVPGTRVTVDGIADAALPAAVEVAAYRIATEALTNAARHADARRVTVHLGMREAPSALVAEISDDGRGIGPTASPGVGLASMADRAAELGGSCQVSAGPSGGTTVRAVLPIAHRSRRPPVDDEGTRVVIVDDHPVFREGLAGTLAADPALSVVATCSDGAEAVATARQLQPDVMVMDLHMPGLGGIEATRQIVMASPHIAVLVVSMLDDQDSVFAAVRAGARGYLLKGASGEEILRAVRSVAAGEAVFGPGVAERMLAYFAESRSRPAAAALPELTDREREVLQMIAAGARNSEIAAQLFISPKTVRNHISNIFTKLHVADRAEAIAVAREAGLGQEG